jgi:hypothetical protein
MLIVSSLCFGLVGASAQQDRRSVILPQAEAEVFVGHRVGLAQIPIDGIWEPMQSDTDNLEANLGQVTELSRKYELDRRIEHPERYFRQYLGILEGDRKLIYVNAFCGIDSGRPPKAWQARLINLYDGGSCVWQAIYDNSTQKFVSLSVNGVA